MGDRIKNAIGQFNQDGICQQSLTVSTPQPATPEAVVAAMVDAIAQVEDGQTLAIGVGTPGPADACGRIAQVAINLVGWHNVPLADYLEGKTDKPTILANDANCAGLGEAWLGAGRRFANLILLTLRTGVGGAIILDRKLFVGHQGAFFLPSVQAEIEQRVLPTSRVGLQILPAQLGNSAGMVGAAKLALSKFGLRENRSISPLLPPQVP